MRTRSLLAVPLAFVLLIAGCGGGDDTTSDDAATDGATDTATEQTDDGDGATGETVEVTGVDYAFEGVPGEVSAGTSLTFTNGSEAEMHELVLMRIDDDETRSVEELLQLPEDEAQDVAEFQGVLVAFPGEDGVNPEDPQAEPQINVDEPGRYALLCFLPEGGDPEAYRTALEEGATEPPDVEGGPPHFTLGMAAELTVTE